MDSREGWMTDKWKAERKKGKKEKKDGKTKGMKDGQTDR